MVMSAPWNDEESALKNGSTNKQKHHQEQHAIKMFAKTTET